MKRKLYRLKEDKIFGGVCSGLAEYLDIDPVLVRIAFVILTLLHGSGLLLYIVLRIIMPSKPVVYSTKYPEDTETVEAEEIPEEESKEENGKKHSEEEQGRLIAGIALIVIGFLFLADKLFPFVNLKDILSLGLILLGGYILWGAVRRTK